MAIDASEVRVAGYGHIYIAPEGTTLPADVDTAMTADWVDLGYATTDGVTFTFSRETEDLDAWQGDKIRVLSLKEPKMAEFTLMQTDAATVTAALGGGSWADVGGLGTFTPPEMGENAVRAMVVEYEDGSDIKYRYCFARVQQEGDVTMTLNREGAVEYPMTMGVLEADPSYTILTNDPAIVKSSARSARQAAPASAE